MSYNLSTTWAVVLALVIVWDLIWRGLALWRAGRNDQPGWFVALMIINSAGILPIIYLLTNPHVVEFEEGKSADKKAK